MEVIFPEIMLPNFLTTDGKLVQDFLFGVFGLGVLVDLPSLEPDDLPEDLVVDVAIYVL